MEYTGGGRKVAPFLWTIGRSHDLGRHGGHTFVTAEAPTRVRFRRAIERRALWMADDDLASYPRIEERERAVGGLH